jgi:hypothetical protein
MGKGLVLQLPLGRFRTSFCSLQTHLKINLLDITRLFTVLMSACQLIFKIINLLFHLDHLDPKLFFFVSDKLCIQFVFVASIALYFLLDRFFLFAFSHEFLKKGLELGDDGLLLFHSVFVECSLLVFFGNAC